MLLIEFTRGDTLELESVTLAPGMSFTIYESSRGWAVGFWDHKKMIFFNAIVCGPDKEDAHRVYRDIVNAHSKGDRFVDVAMRQHTKWLEKNVEEAET